MLAAGLPKQTAMVRHSPWLNHGTISVVCTEHSAISAWSQTQCETTAISESSRCSKMYCSTACTRVASAASDSWSGSTSDCKHQSAPDQHRYQAEHWPTPRVGLELRNPREMVANNLENHVEVDALCPSTRPARCRPRIPCRRCRQTRPPAIAVPAQSAAGRSCKGALRMSAPLGGSRATGAAPRGEPSLPQLSA